MNPAPDPKSVDSMTSSTAGQLNRKNLLFDLIIAAAGIGLFTAAAEVVDELGFKQVKFWLKFLGFAFVQFAIVHHFLKSRSAWAWFWVVVILELLAVSILKPKPPMVLKPNLVLYLRDQSIPEPALKLTNDFVRLDSKYQSKETGTPYLIMRIPEGQTNSRLFFGVANAPDDHQTNRFDAELTAEAVRLDLVFYDFTEPKWTADAKWNQKKITERLTVLNFDFGNSILPDSGVLAPHLDFEILGGHTEPILIDATIRCKGHRDIELRFLLGFIRSSTPTSPVIMANSIEVVKVVTPGGVTNYSWRKALR